MAHEDSDPIEDDFRVFQIDAQQLDALRDSADAHDFAEFMRVYTIVHERNAELAREQKLSSKSADPGPEPGDESVQVGQEVSHKTQLGLLSRELGDYMRENDKLKEALVQEVLRAHNEARANKELQRQLEENERELRTMHRLVRGFSVKAG